jgi:hypothetical protein
MFIRLEKARKRGGSFLTLPCALEKKYSFAQKGHPMVYLTNGSLLLSPMILLITLPNG